MSDDPRADKAAPRKRAGAPRRRKPVTPPPVPEPAEGVSMTPVMAVEAACVVPGCDATPEWRNLCAAHRHTHRGLMGPKEK